MPTMTPNVFYRSQENTEIEGKILARRCDRKQLLAMS